ncbi:glycosyltransferase [Hirschia litorea]|uniref:Glycosyltransferase n=1 Tax=Hirschia litorea TaxID=1199156 RepID=A0ABW2IIR9_9PROT
MSIDISDKLDEVNFPHPTSSTSASFQPPKNFQGKTTNLFSTPREHSIRSGLWRTQKLALLLCVILISACIAQNLLPLSTFVIGVSIIVFCQILFRLFAAIIAIISPPTTLHTDSRLPPNLPKFTLLIPLYKEEAVAQSSVEAMKALNYPLDKLEVFYLLEPDDSPTQLAVQKAIRNTNFKILIAPDTGPKTKPKALNYGLQYATGDIVSVFDAEDTPHPYQLLEVAHQYAQNDKNLAVVQAPLHAYNGNESWIAAQFDLEYAIHFDVWLPAIAKLGWPMPLGGTSNHFDRRILQNVGAWDEYNVTEDADLGFRLARNGYKAQMISLPTLEEAPVRFSQWLPQRTRWIKGHIQTLMVLTRFPTQAIRALGLWKCLGITITFISAIFAAGIHGPFLIYLLSNIFLGNIDIGQPQNLLILSSYISVALTAIPSKAWKDRKLTLLTTPLYWPLMSLAFFKAIWELKSCPHSWSKTPHGVSKIELANLTP